MHEIGHTLGIDHEAGYSLMNHDNFNPTMTNSMYNTLTAQGYGIDRTVPINWSWLVLYKWGLARALSFQKIAPLPS